MKILASVLIAGLFLSSSICHAEILCPWINKATAFGVLGTTEDAATANVSEISSTACDFTYRDGDTTRELRVTVEQVHDGKVALDAYETRCGRDVTPLRAIGNEAVMCTPNQKAPGKLIVGRVRDNAFTISLITSSRNDPLIPPETLTQRIELVAEQVSGNLF